MSKSDKKGRLLQGQTATSKIQWAAKGTTRYAEKAEGIPDTDKEIGFDVERYGFYFRTEPEREIHWLSAEELDYLGRRDPEPTSQEDIIATYAYCLFKCLSHSDGKGYTEKQLNHSWFIRHSVEAGFTVDDAQAVLFDESTWAQIEKMCLAMMQASGITDLPIKKLDAQVPKTHRMEEAKAVSAMQRFLQRMEKHADTRFQVPSHLKPVKKDKAEDEDAETSET